MARKKYKNEQEEILHHEILKQSCIYTYSTSQSDLPSGYQVHKTYDNKSGLYATVLIKDNDVIVAIRGTEIGSGKDWKSNGSIMLRNPSAIEAYKEVFGIGTTSKTQKYSSNNSCVGSYSVSGYTRSDGTKVGDYTRTCGAKHNN